MPDLRDICEAAAMLLCVAGFWGMFDIIIEVTR